MFLKNNFDKHYQSRSSDQVPDQALNLAKFFPIL